MVKSDSLVAAVRVRGTVKVRWNIAKTLNRLRLRHVNNLVLLKPTESIMGMLQNCKDFITFGEVDKETLSALAAKASDKADDAKLVELLLNGEKAPAELIKMPIRLHPPRHGYEGIKKGFSQGGSLGYRGEKINKLINRML